MCGILGAWNLNTSQINECIKKLSLRGRDGYGYFTSRFDDSIDRTEKKLENSELHNSVGPYIIDICLANSRATPTTEYETGAGFDINNQQPFENERFVVVHNGIIANDQVLRKTYMLETESKVDSAILPELFSKFGVITGLKMLKGSFAIICWDKKSRMLYAAKNFMPLRVYLDANEALFISLQEMAPLQPTEEFPPYTCMEINTSTGSVEQYSLYPRERNKKVLVICSSGIDSTTTAYLYKYLGYEVVLLHFLYGQAAETSELYSVQKIAEDLGSKLIVYDAKTTFSPFKNVSKLLHQKKAEDKKRMLDAESTLSYVPNRNMIFASIAAGLAEMLECDTVAMGLQQSDSVYPDNNPTYLNCVDATLKYSLNWGTNVKFTAPLVHLIKHEVISLGKKIGVNYNLVCSCYYPKMKNGKVVPCGVCGCCQYWKIGMKMSEEKDFVGDVNAFLDKYVRGYV